jgi:surface carbohydrate biosynthesis protein
MKIKVRKAIFVEYEYETRELPWRSLLASKLRDYFNPIFIGYREELMNYALTLRLQGIYFAKDLPPERLPKARVLKDLGIRFVLLDEEAFSVFQLPEKIYYYRYTKPVLEFVDAICVGSFVEHEILVHNLRGSRNCPKILRGLSPRYHLNTLTPNYKNPICIRKKVLFPMSMPVFHAAGPVERRKQIERMLASLRNFVPNREFQSTQRIFLHRYTRMRRLNLLLLIYLNRASAELGLDVMVRTHPTEKLPEFDKWAKKKFPLLSFSRPLQPIGKEIVKHDLVVHTNCTSGLESHNFFGIKTICLNQVVTNLRSSEKSFFGVYGHNVLNMDELVEALQSSSGVVGNLTKRSFFYDNFSIQDMVNFLSTISKDDKTNEERESKKVSIIPELLKNIQIVWLRIKSLVFAEQTLLRKDSRFEQVAVGVYRLRARN